MGKKHINIVRHGDIGQTDLLLSALGKQQATLLKEIFCQVPLDNIYCSDLGRALLTANIIA